jgi:ribosomal protein S27E
MIRGKYKHFGKGSTMKKGHFLELHCQNCKHPIQFSIFEIKGQHVACETCQLVYDFNDPVLKRQLEKFENLCHQIQLSEEILSDTSVGVCVGDREVQIPYKLLLTRLNSTLQLIIDNRPVRITFRVEPAKIKEKDHESIRKTEKIDHDCCRHGRH